MKPFDLELAKAGHPVCTRDGHKARIICFDKEDSVYPIVALIEHNGRESVSVHNEMGKVLCGPDKAEDLMMFPEKKEGWINIYEGNQTGVRIFDSEENAFKYRNAGHIDTIKIEWEE